MGTPVFRALCEGWAAMLPIADENSGASPLQAQQARGEQILLSVPVG